MKGIENKWQYNLIMIILYCTGKASDHRWSGWMPASLLSVCRSFTTIIVWMCVWIGKWLIVEWTALESSDLLNRYASAGHLPFGIKVNFHLNASLISLLASNWAHKAFSIAPTSSGNSLLPTKRCWLSFSHPTLQSLTPVSNFSQHGDGKRRKTELLFLQNCMYCFP